VGKEKLAKIRWKWERLHRRAQKLEGPTAARKKGKGTVGNTIRPSGLWKGVQGGGPDGRGNRLSGKKKKVVVGHGVG